MTRRTSIDVYRRIEAEGLLSAKRFEVYSLLYREGPLTGSEINSKLGSKSGHKRLSELQERGLIYEVGTRLCTITGEKVIEWDVTENLPSEPPRDRGAPTREQLRALLNAIYEGREKGVSYDEDALYALSWLEGKVGSKSVSEAPEEPPEWLEDWFGPQP